MQCELLNLRDAGKAILVLLNHFVTLVLILSKRLERLTQRGYKTRNSGSERSVTKHQTARERLLGSKACQKTTEKQQPATQRSAAGLWQRFYCTKIDPQSSRRTTSCLQPISTVQKLGTHHQKAEKSPELAAPAGLPALQV